MIKQVDFLNGKKVENILDIIRLSNKTVAKDFGLTRENAPGHTSFLTKEKLLTNKKNKSLYCLEKGTEIYGCVVLEKPVNSENEFFLENLSVLPDFRHKGYGKILVEHIINTVTKLNGQKITIGLIDENEILKKWYLDLGFEIIGTKKFKHLPFTVCFMDVKLLQQ